MNTDQHGWLNVNRSPLTHGEAPQASVFIRVHPWFHVSVASGLKIVFHPAADNQTYEQQQPDDDHDDRVVDEVRVHHQGHTDDHWSTLSLPLTVDKDSHAYQRE
jgi:hypothetical protein